jgi:hypothetical protein
MSAIMFNFSEKLFAILSDSNPLAMVPLLSCYVFAENNYKMLTMTPVVIFIV